MKMLALPQELRPRERLKEYGPRTLSSAELLAIILRTGNKKENVLELSARLLQRYDLRALSRAGIAALIKEKGVGEAKACQIMACFELGRRLASFSKTKKLRINSAKDIAKMFMPELSSLKKEHFIGIYLDSRKNIVKEEIISIGSLDSSVVHPREIFRPAIEESAAALILVHNHPSGDPEPSEEDIEVTKQLSAAGELLGIELLDHVIIGQKTYFSFREKN